MAKIEGVNDLLRELRERKRLAKEASNASVIVGYTQAYAIYVHEDMTARHPVGQAKYLEQPARELSNSGTLSGIIARVYRQTGRLIDGLLFAGLRLQRDSQKLVPIDTGALKGSAFTRKE